MIEQKVLEFVKGLVFDPADFVIQTDGVRWDDPELAVEPHRRFMDRRILDFVKGHAFHPADFRIRSDWCVGSIRKWEVCGRFNSCTPAEGKSKSMQASQRATL